MSFYFYSFIFLKHLNLFNCLGFFFFFLQKKVMSTRRVILSLTVVASHFMTPTQTVDVEQANQHADIHQGKTAAFVINAY